MSNLMRRDFIGSSAGLFAAVAAPLALVAEPAQALYARPPRLWHAAEILVGQSDADQLPAPAIRCPLYFANGHRSPASHSLDLGSYPVQSDIRWNDDSIAPDFGASLAVNTAPGTDGATWLLVGAEGSVSGGRGVFTGISRAIVRCKYKVVPDVRGPMLVACSYCMVVLLRG